MPHTVSEEDLSEEFSFFGVEIDNEHVIAKLQELCTLHRLDAGSIATEWVAYKHSKKGVELALEVLETFERERLSKKNQKIHKKEVSSPVYSRDDLPMDIEGAEELFTAYGAHTPMSKSTVSNKRQHTPENMNFNKRLTGPNRSPAVPFSPASFSPASATPAKKYNSRNNRGEVVVSHGPVNGVKWEGSDQTVTVEHYNTDQSLSRTFKYMFQKLSEKFRVLDAIIEDMADHLKAEHKIEDFSHVALPTQEDVTVVGRVCCDSQGKLNAKSVLLEGSVDVSAGKTIPVDLSKLKEYGLFPGQVVAMDGLNSTGKSFIASKLYDSVPLPLPDVTNTEPGTTRLAMMIAAGPFSTSDSLSYEPLTDLVQQIQSVKPDVCILMGPFVDCKNVEIENGRLNVTFDELFKSQIEQIAKATERLGIKIILLPSHRDIHHDVVYPQPPFEWENKYKHIQMMPDPCTLKINNIVFGLTSTDVLFHLGAEEISFPPGSSDRLGRLTQHILNQHSYYPLYPPNDELSIDYEQFYQHCTMPVTPHILVVPSEFKQFIKEMKGCCCINPGRLTKGLTGSTFAKLVVQVNNLKPQQSIVPNITAQITVADNKTSVTQMMDFVFEKVENMLVKEDTGYIRVLLLVLVWLRCGLPLTKNPCDEDLRVPEITNTGVRLCRSSSSRGYICSHVNSSYLLRRYKGLFFQQTDEVPSPYTQSTGVLRQATLTKNSSIASSQVDGMLNGDRCCETDWKLQKHPLITKNSKGKKICLVAFGNYTQMAYYGYCSRDKGLCKRCAQEYTYTQVLVYKNCQLQFDFIEIPISCICLG